MHDENAHDHGKTPRARLLAGFCLTLAFAGVEAVGGFLSGSLALLADSVHMLADAAALGLALLAALVSGRPHTQRATYGFHRAEVLAALANAVLLGALILRIGWEAVLRLAGARDVEVDGRTMLVVSCVGLLVNVVVLWVLRSGRAPGDNLNLRAAAAHVTGDLAGSAAAIVAAVLILARGWHIADPLASLGVAVLIGISAWRILRESAEVLLEVAPPGIDVGAVTRALGSIESVTGVHDLHVWTVTPGRVALSVHLETDASRSPAALLGAANEVLGQEFGIWHTTIQVEPGERLGPGGRLPAHPG
ncbi:MAG: cation transporter [Acidobacteria bacterium]|nr:cation transporter [Acidobacteriota bacterium]